VSIQELYRQSRRTALWGIFANLGIALGKLAGGYFGDSVALMSDSAHSFGDAVVSGMILAALILSQQPPDREHPYGHTRAEAIAGSSLAFLLIMVAFWVAWEASHEIGKPFHEPAVYTLWIAAANIVLKEGLYQYNRRVAERTGSRAVLASAWDHRLDALSSVAVLVGIALARWGGPLGHLADPIAAEIVAVIILWSGARLFWDSFQELMDRQADPELVAQVRAAAAAVPGVRGIEKLWVRKTGLEYLVDIHVEVDPTLTVREGHAIAHAVKDRLVGGMDLIKDVLVHIEPAPDGQAIPGEPRGFGSGGGEAHRSGG
jgi:cation diffusion facilitator family transporter